MQLNNLCLVDACNLIVSKGALITGKRLPPKPFYKSPGIRRAYQYGGGTYIVETWGGAFHAYETVFVPVGQTLNDYL